MKFKYSIITPFYNTGEYLRESIESVINQDIGFEDNVQLILIDDGSTDNSKDIALEYHNDYPENILVISKENGGVASARNLGLEHVEGEYVNFLDSDDKLSPDTLTIIDEFFKSNDVSIACIPIRYFDAKTGFHHLNYKFESTRVIDLDEEFDCTHFHVASSFIRNDVIKEYRFDSHLVNGSDGLLMNEMLVSQKKYGVVNSTYYNYRKRPESSSIMDSSTKSKRFFTEKMKYYYKHLIDYSIDLQGNVPKFIQYAIVLDLNGMISAQNFSQLYTDSNEIREFWDTLMYILNHIDNDIILNHHYLEEYFKSFLIYLKNGREFNIGARPKRNKVFLRTNEFIINKVHNHKIHIHHIDIYGDSVYISGHHISSCDSNALSFEACVKSNGHEEVILCRKKDVETKYPNGFLAVKWLFNYNFEVRIPIKYSEFAVSLRIRYHENENEVVMFPKLRFKPEYVLSKQESFLTDYHKISFKDNEFYIKEHSAAEKVKFKLQSTYEWQSRKLLYSLPKSIGRRIIYKKTMNKTLNLSDPKDLNEKINWLMVNRYGEREGMLTDKQAVKKIIADMNIPDLNIPKSYRTYKSVDEINLDELPERFVLKCNHFSGNVFICRDKDDFDLNKAKYFLNKQLNMNFGLIALEYHYEYIEPCIIAEEFLDDSEHDLPLDYKFYSFDGKVESILFCSERANGLKLDDYDRDWKMKDYLHEEYASRKYTNPPKNLKRMIEIAEILGKGHPFVRVDLYEINNKIYFGELTFTPAQAMIRYYRQETLDLMGDMVSLPE